MRPAPSRVHCFASTHAALVPRWRTTPAAMRTPFAPAKTRVAWASGFAGADPGATVASPPRSSHARTFAEREARDAQTVCLRRASSSNNPGLAQAPAPRAPRPAQTGSGGPAVHPNPCPLSLRYASETFATRTLILKHSSATTADSSVPFSARTTHLLTSDPRRPRATR